MSGGDLFCPCTTPVKIFNAIQRFKQGLQSFDRHKVGVFPESVCAMSNSEILPHQWAVFFPRSGCGNAQTPAAINATMLFPPLDNSRRFKCLVKLRKNVFLPATNVPQPAFSAPALAWRRRTPRQWFGVSSLISPAPICAASLRRRSLAATTT